MFELWRTAVREARVPGSVAAVLLLSVALTGCVAEGPPVAVGTLERDRIELLAESSEPIVVVAVSEGDRVAEGDLLLELDRRRAEARTAALVAARDLAAARLAEVVRGARPEVIAEARARLSEAKSALIQAEPELVRARELVAEGVAPPSTFEAAQATLEAARARVEAAVASLEGLLNGATVEELDQADAEVAVRRAELTEARISLERLTIVAPRPARVDALPFELGEQPPVGATVAVLLVDSAPHARVYVPSEVRPGLAPGDSVTVRVEGVVTPFAGRVRRVSSDPAFTPFYALTERDRGRLAYLAEIDLEEESAAELPSGLPVEVDF